MEWKEAEQMMERMDKLVKMLDRHRKELDELEKAYKNS